MRLSRTFWLTAGVALAILGPFVLWGERVDAAIARGLPVIAGRPALAAAVLVGLLAVDIVAPVPSSLVSTAGGAVFGFGWGLVVSFVGMTLGGAAGYGLGRGMSARALRWVGAREADRLRRMEARWGIGFLVAARPVPVLAEASAVFAGIARRPAAPVLTALAIGNLGVSAVYAAVGAWGRETEAFLGAFGLSLLLAAGVLWGQWRCMRDGAPPSGNHHGECGDG